MTRALVVDDESQILRALRTSLQARQYEVITAGTGREGLDVIASQLPDIVILDLGLPDLDGIEITRRARAFSDVPIIVLTVSDAQSDKIAALDAGADDYVTKPFAMDELLARMRAALRRSAQGEPAPAKLTYGDIVIDFVNRSVTVRGEAVHLTPTELRLVEAMSTSPGKLLTHSWLLREVWGPGYHDESQYLRVYIGQLRKKLEDEPANPRWIITEPGIGYRWAEG